MTEKSNTRNTSIAFCLLNIRNVKNANRAEFNNKRAAFVATANAKIQNGNTNESAATSAYDTLKKYYNAHKKNAPAAAAASSNKPRNNKQ